MAEDTRLLEILVKTYGDVDEAKADLEALRELYDRLGTSHYFDAAVLRKTAKGKVRIEDRYEAGTRHEALRGLGFGLAIGLVAAVFPPVGIAAAAIAGGVGGAAIGAVVGHVQSGVPRDTLRKIADRLNASESALIAAYDTSIADQVAKSIKVANRVITKIADLKAEELADEIEHAGA